MSCPYLVKLAECIPFRAGGVSPLSEPHSGGSRPPLGINPTLLPEQPLGLLRLLRVDQPVVVGVELLEHVPRAEELLPRQVAVHVPVHPLEPDRADRRPRG